MAKHGYFTCFFQLTTIHFHNHKSFHIFYFSFYFLQLKAFNYFRFRIFHYLHIGLFHNSCKDNLQYMNIILI